MVNSGIIATQKTPFLFIQPLDYILYKPVQALFRFSLYFSQATSKLHVTGGC